MAGIQDSKLTEKRDGFKLTPEEEAILGICIKVEEKCAALYRHFEASYRNIPYVARLWETIAKEEDRHAESFRVAARMKGAGIDSIGSGETDFALLRDVDRFIDSARAKPSTPYDALKFAISLERDIEEFHVVAVLNFHDDVVERAFKNAMAHTRDHIAKLEHALDEFR